MGAPLPDPATVVVVGGGPAGSFFAIRLLRAARASRRSVHVTILERKTEVCFYRPAAFCSWEGCNYCAGGISPRLADMLRESGIELPEEAIESRAAEVIVHGDWKSIQLPIPAGREMLSVFRGSRPRQRPGRYANFDSFLLHLAEREGAEVITADVSAVEYAQGLPVVSFRTPVSDSSLSSDQALRADLLVLAGGVNRSPGTDVDEDPLFPALRRLIPRFRPPAVRRAVIAELQADEEVLRPLEGEVHFAQYGSRDLHIEMSSLLPKDRWMTVVLLGKAVDRARPSEYLDIVQRFMELPHIRRVLPPAAGLRPCCCCHPNMTVGAASHPFGDRLALIGDMAVSRLYKDGLYSAFVTASALAACALDHGVDERSLARHFAPVVERFQADNRWGRVIFALSRAVFAHPALSRVLYQAVLTERKTAPQAGRRLADVLWAIASGDDSYRHILASMLHPAAVASIVLGGVTTIRNRVTELVFGLDWTGIGRYPTGVALEQVPGKRGHFLEDAAKPYAGRPPEMERMYTIRIRAGADAVFRQLGAFGDPGRQYFHPRFVHVQRLAGAPNRPGTTVRYHFSLLRRLSFSLVLEQAVPGRYLRYRIVDGFGAGGVLGFDIEPLRPGVELLTIYVGFDFRRGSGVLSRCGWFLVRRLFPRFAHDVLWNNSLCAIKQLAEAEPAASAHESASQATEE